MSDGPTTPAPNDYHAAKAAIAHIAGSPNHAGRQARTITTIAQQLPSSNRWADGDSSCRPQGHPLPAVASAEH